MGRLLESNKLLNTLGFFLNGIPVVFLKIDIALPGDTSRGRQYLEFYQLTQATPVAERGLPGNDILDSYEYAITPVHEIRHFHDAMLSRPLFELFILSCKQQIYVLQLSGRFKHVTSHDLPFSFEEAARHVDADGKRLMEMLQDIQKNYDRIYRNVFGQVTYDGGSVSIRDLLESNAIITEIANLISVHGLDTAEAYYRTKVLQLGPEYHRLLQEFKLKCGDLLRTVDVLHGVIAHCLYGNDNPAVAFAKLMENRLGSNELTAFVRPESVDELFAKEQELKDRIHRIRIETLEGVELTKRTTGRAGLNRLLRLYENIYAMRETLIGVYVREWRYNLQRYLEETDRLPTPPVLFWADESQIMGVPESELAKRRPDYYVIRGHRVDGDVVVVVGLVSNAGTKAAVRMEIADGQLVSRYCYDRLFKTSGVIYAPLVDEVYQGILERQILGVGELGKRRSSKGTVRRFGDGSASL